MKTRVNIINDNKPSLSFCQKQEILKHGGLELLNLIQQDIDDCWSAKPTIFTNESYKQWVSKEMNDEAGRDLISGI